MNSWRFLGCIFAIVFLAEEVVRHSFTHTSKEEVILLLPNLFWKANCKSFSSGALSSKSSSHVYPCWMTPKLSPLYDSFQFINIYPDHVVLAIVSAVLMLWLSLDQTVNRHCSLTHAYGMSVFSLLSCTQDFELTLLLLLILLVLMEKCQNVKSFSIYMYEYQVSRNGN